MCSHLNPCDILLEALCCRRTVVEAVYLKPSLPHLLNSTVNAQLTVCLSNLCSTSEYQPLCRMNKDIRMNLDVSKRFSATDYLQARPQHVLRLSMATLL